MDGEVAEWLKAAASKAVEVIFASVSSNLTLSARKINCIDFHPWLVAIGLWLNVFTCGSMFSSVAGGYWLLACSPMFSPVAGGY